MTTHTWTEGDVQALIRAARVIDTSIRENRRVEVDSMHHMCLHHALRPFQLDPDDELVEKIDRMRVDPSPRIATDIIAAVREHDARRKA